MRITNTTIARNYTNNLNRNLSQLNTANMRVTSTRKFMSMSEDTAAGVRAMKVRRNLDQLTSYMDNAKTVEGKLGAAEDNMLQISTLSNEAYALFVSGVNGDKGFEDKKIVAEQLKQIQKSMLATANAKYADNYLFGGTNASEAPFTLDAGGELLYNGMKVSDIDPNSTNLAIAAASKALLNDAAHVDIGMGLQMNGQEVVGNSAFESTLVGIKMFGYGTDADGNDLNIYNKIGEMIDMLENDPSNTDRGGKIMEQYKQVSINVNIQVTDLGAKQEYLEFMLDRMDLEAINLKERQNNIEIIDPAEAIMDWQMQQYVYNAALQMGSRLLQPSLFNYMG